MDDVVTQMLRVLNAGFPAVQDMTGAEARAVIASRRQPVLNLDDVRATDDRTIPGPNGPIPVRVYHPHGDDRPRAAVVFCHGGGFVFCDLETHDGFCRTMARHLDAVVVSVDYRLAPEHRAPAAAQDAHAAYSWVVEHAAELGIEASRVAVAGDSAGANLAAVTAILCREHDVPAPVAQVLIYPVLDPACDTESYETRATGYVNTRAAMQWYWRNYLGDIEGGGLPEPAHLVAPMRAASHAGLPPTLVVTVGLDPLHSEGVAYATQLRAAGVPVVHRDFPGLFHGFLTMLSFAPAAAARELVWADVRALLSTKDVLR